MNQILVVLACLVAVGSCYPLWYPYHPATPSYYYWGHPSYYGGYYYGGYPYPHAPHYGATPGSRLIYYGQFKGSCDAAPDGLYYVDEYSFAYCSNGQKTIQPCAEGSANPPIGHFKHGGYYGLYDFCAVNLLAQGAYTPDKKIVLPPHPPKEEKHYSEERTYVVEEKGYKGRSDGYQAPVVKVEGYVETKHFEEPPKKY